MEKQKGFSLLEITIAMGLLGVVSIGVMKLFESINSGTRTVSKRAAVQDFNNSIKNQVMGKRDVCSNNARQAFIGRSIETIDGKQVIAGNHGYKKIDFMNGKSLQVNDISTSGAHKVETIVYQIKGIQNLTAVTHTGNYTHSGKLAVNYNLQFCKSSNQIADCPVQNLGRMPSNLPEVEVLMKISGSTVEELECQTLDVPLLAESMDYTDQLKEQLCRAEEAIVKLTGKKMVSSCGKLIEADEDAVVPLYARDDGSLTDQIQYDYKDNKCNCCGKKCNCSPPSCPSGFTAVNRKKDVTCAWTDVTCCGAKRRMTHTLTCRKQKSPIGHVVSPSFNYDSLADAPVMPNPMPVNPPPVYLPAPKDLLDNEPCGRREVAAADGSIRIEMEQDC